MSLGILLLSTDLKFAKDLQSAAKLCLEPFTVYPCSNGQKFTEYGLKYKLHAILTDESFSATLGEGWVQKLRQTLSKELENDKVPFFLLSSEINQEGVQNSIQQGYTDIFIKPIDISMLLQKLHVYIPGARLLKEDLLFSMSVNDDVQIAISGKVVKASEYGATIEMDRNFQPGEIYTFMAPMLAPADSPNPGVSLVRVLGSSPGAKNGQYLTTITFLAPHKSVLASIRVWLKKQYIKSSSQNERTV